MKYLCTCRFLYRSRSRSLSVCILWRWQTKTKIVMLNLHKIPREFILMSQWKYERVEHICTLWYIRHTYIYFLQHTSWQATTCRCYLCQQIMHLPREAKAKAKARRDYSGTTRDSSKRPSCSSLPHSVIISVNCRPIADWVCDTRKSFIVCAINVTIDWGQNFHNLT